jgi:DNA-binding CsgD family transcriptional regulator
LRPTDGAERFARIGWPLAEAHCLELAGDRAGALAIYRRLGCAADLRRIEHAASAGGSGPLSPRERELARLVVEGKNNREAATELSIMIKAVEKYLTSIYRKLGVTSRGQLTGHLISERHRDASLPG